MAPNDTITVTTKPIEFDYFILHTGYTSRTICHYLNIGLEFTQVEGKKVIAGEDEDYMHSYEDETDIQDYKDQFQDNEYVPLVIRDDVWGAGTYILNNPHVPIDEINKILPACKSGEILFKCSNMQQVFTIINMLQELDYCGCFKGSSPYEMKVLELSPTNSKILVVEYDCESG